MVNWLQVLNQLNFVWRHTKAKFVSMMSPKCSIVENDGVLMLMALHTHTFCYSSNILGCMHCFWLFTLWCIDENARFFHFFRKITNIRSFRNPYAIFAHILQHYHDFQSNVAIFPSVVEAYTQTYSFGRRIKLIIYQMRHKLSVTIHEISTS